MKPFPQHKQRHFSGSVLRGGLHYAYRYRDLHVISLKSFFSMTQYGYFKLPALDGVSCAVCRPSTWNCTVILDKERERERAPWGVMDISMWYQLFLCGQLHHSLTDVHLLVSWCSVGCVQATKEELGLWGMSAAHIINKHDWWSSH